MGLDPMGQREEDMRMNYFWLTVKHKWFVFLAGRKLGVSLWRLIKHDWSKFTPSEYPHYQRRFFGDKKPCTAFDTAWLHHIHCNDHHWEHWILQVDSEIVPGTYDRKSLPMPEVAAREMLADWMGASRAYEGKWPKPGEWRWLHENWSRIWLHEETDTLLAGILFGMGYMGKHGDVPFRDTGAPEAMG